MATKCPTCGHCPTCGEANESDALKEIRALKEEMQKAQPAQPQIIYVYPQPWPQQQYYPYYQIPMYQAIGIAQGGFQQQMMNGTSLQEAALIYQGGE